MKNDPNLPCTKCFGSLSVSSRMKIYNFLKLRGKSTVSEVVAMAKLTQPTVSYHLMSMKDAGLLESFKVGKEVFYSVSNSCPSSESSCVLKSIEFPREEKA